MARGDELVVEPCLGLLSSQLKHRVPCAVNLELAGRFVDFSAVQQTLAQPTNSHICAADRRFNVCESQASLASSVPEWAVPVGDTASSLMCVHASSKVSVLGCEEFPSLDIARGGLSESLNLPTLLLGSGLQPGASCLVTGRTADSAPALSMSVAPMSELGVCSRRDVNSYKLLARI